MSRTFHSNALARYLFVTAYIVIFITAGVCLFGSDDTMHPAEIVGFGVAVGVAFAAIGFAIAMILRVLIEGFIETVFPEVRERSR